MNRGIELSLLIVSMIGLLQVETGMEIEAEVAHDSSEKHQKARRVFHCLCERSVNADYPQCFVISHSQVEFVLVGFIGFEKQRC